MIRSGQRQLAAASCLMGGLALAVPTGGGDSGGAARGTSAVVWSAEPQAGETDRASWRRAEPGRALVFPDDHASHPDYKIEWWYYTGNVRAEDGRRFGYQLTFFRVGVDRAPANPSRWAVRDLFMAHLAITDVAGGAFRFEERLRRGAVGLAGAATDRYRVWNGSWQAERDPAGRHRLRAGDDRLGLKLVLRSPEAPVLHGLNGFSQKGSTTGNSTHYYSLTRMPTEGTLSLDGESFVVEGASWMDHEFGTSFLEAGQQGWDWFSLQLDDQSELMVFQLRRADGSRDPRSAGTLVQQEGQLIPLMDGAFSLEPLRHWTSEASGARYPVAWRVRVPSAGLDLFVEALVRDQELVTAGSAGVTYWEGAVAARGTRRGTAVAGVGYLEMTGYAGPSMSSVLR